VAGVLVAVYIILTLARAVNIAAICLISSTNLHNAMTKALSRAKILFFDSNPVGRIQTRFSKDIQILDFQLPF
jgi:ABC-type multidrug transport system fused ATPase/permease subunit